MDASELGARLATWCRDRGIRLLILFGSRSTGSSDVRSDLDLAVWSSDRRRGRDQLVLWNELAEVLQEEPDLVWIGADTDPVLGFEIARDGRLVYEHAAGTWEHERMRLWHCFVDSAPFLNAARSNLRRFAEDVGRGA